MEAKIDSPYLPQFLTYPDTQPAENAAVVIPLKKRLLAVNGKVSRNIRREVFFFYPDIVSKPF
jgi:hypothetical protein